jgi:predicted Zn-dependent protease
LYNGDIACWPMGLMSMGQEPLNQLLHQGIAAARGGQRDEARTILQDVVRRDPRNEIGWMWLSSVAADDGERLFCLKKLLEVNPQNEFAMKGLRALGVDPEGREGERVSGTVVPVLDEAKYARVLPAVDDFLRGYDPLLSAALRGSWARKRRGRYGESGAARLRQAMFAAGLALLMVLFAGAVILVQQTGVLEGDGQRLGLLNTRIPSLTPRPTFTPTVGGPTPTDFPVLLVPPTTIPRDVTPADPYGLAVPTESYPRADASVARLVEEAAAHYWLGDYQTALTLLQEERERSEPHCYPLMVYFEALSLAGIEDFPQAIALLEWAQNYEPPRGYSSCRNEPILLAGLAETRYRQDNRSLAALDLASQALASDNRLIAAVLTKARVELARGDLAAARGTVTQSLLNRPNDLNLLVLAAEIELADGQPASSLEQLGRALANDPALLPALKLQTEAFLRLAAQAQPDERGLQYFGLAVRSAQTLLHFYPGEPAGFLYLAEARLGEGNVELAETALLRILENAASLPDSANPVVERAYALRGELCYRSGRLLEAYADFEKAAAAGRGAANATVAERLVTIGLRLGDYNAALGWLSQLVALDPANAQYRLWQAQMSVETCSLHPDELTCDYDGALVLLSDAFIARLPEESQRADALSYRAQAQYYQIAQRGAAEAGQGRLALQLALNDNTQALLVRNTAVDQYMRARILEALNEPARALESYQWVLYWGDWYNYPFQDSSFEQRVAMVAERAAQPAAAGTPTAAVTPTATQVETEGAEGSIAGTPTPQRGVAGPAAATPEVTVPVSSSDDIP